MDDKVLSDVSIALSTSSPISDSDVHNTLNMALTDFSRSVSRSHLAEYADGVTESFEEALREGSDITMLPNYSINPSGREQGDLLVVDLGGSTLRVAVISIAAAQDGAGIARSRKDRITIAALRKWTVENSTKTVGKKFFEWMCDRIHETLSQQSVIATDSEITTGITWSFPLESTSYNSANIHHMGKGYTVAEEVQGRDLKHLLESTLKEKHHIRINVQSIINDSLAVYSAARFLDSNTIMALVLGTGLNFSCQLPALTKIAQQKHIGTESSILFNTETSLFGHNLCVPFSTKYDEEIDRRFGLTRDRKRSLLEFRPHMTTDPKTNTIFQPFELLTSGRYLPELARLVLVEMIEQKEIFANQKNFGAVSTPFEGFSGELMCFIAECKNNAQIAQKLEAAFGWNPNLVEMSDVVNIQLLVNAIIRRLAFIVAIAIVAFIKLLEHHGGIADKNITIGYVGSVMEYFVQLRAMVVNFVNECWDMQKLGVRVRIEGIDESSLVGTAIAAASRACSPELGKASEQ